MYTSGGCLIFEIQYNILHVFTPGQMGKGNEDERSKCKFPYEQPLHDY